VDVSLSIEQQQLQAAVRAFCSDHATPTQVREAMTTELGYEPETWRLLSSELGLTSLAVPEKYAGAGGDWLDVAIALRETGRSVLPAPLLGTVWAAAAVLCALDAGGDAELAAELLPALASGDLIGAVAVDGELTARESPRGWLLDGVAEHVLDGPAAGLFVVAASVPDPGRLDLFALSVPAAGLDVDPLVTLDQTRRQARLRLAAVPARRLGGDGGELRDRVTDLARVALAAEASGGAESCLETIVTHLLTREQFGRPLGSFQALQHRCADLAVQVEGARATALCTAWTAAQLPGELPVIGPLAKAVCAAAYRLSAYECIQMHGGVGFTWEHPAHLHLKRATATELLLGDATTCRALVADRVGL
jgi:alkylation response protein AidB-like acyl-CoA dehydrogenase